MLSGETGGRLNCELSLPLKNCVKQPTCGVMGQKGDKERLENMVHQILKSGVYHNPQSATCFGHEKPSSAEIFSWLWILINRCYVQQLIVGVYIYETPIVTYASETWVLNETIIQKLLVLDRKILRRIFGPTKENQIWRIKTNEELDKLIKQKNIANLY